MLAMQVLSSGPLCRAHLVDLWLPFLLPFLWFFSDFLFCFLDLFFSLFSFPFFDFFFSFFDILFFNFFALFLLLFSFFFLAFLALVLFLLFLFSFFSFFLLLCDCHSYVLLLYNDCFISKFYLLYSFKSQFHLRNQTVFLCK